MQVFISYFLKMNKILRGKFSFNQFFGNAPNGSESGYNVIVIAVLFGQDFGFAVGFIVFYAIQIS